MNSCWTIFDRLSETLAARHRLRPGGSYATQLFDKGVEAIGDKLLEEADELARAEGRSRVIHEAADLLFHLMVLLENQDLTLADVATELARREGISGLEEKANRTQHS